MAKQTINIGASPNDGTGTPLRTSFDYCNLNFTELYTATGPSGNNIVVPGNATITGDLTVDTSTLKVDSTNNRVGIGTATPALPLDVVGGMQVTSGSAGGLFQWAYGASASSRSWRAWNDVSANGDFQISTSTTRTGSTYSDRYRIDVTGIHEWSNTSGTAMTLNSTGLNVANGNVILGTSGKGIDFSAVTGGTGTATGNVLNDYEEGTFTPTVQGSTAAGVGVYTVQVARYTKTGRLVTVEIYIAWTAHTGTGNLQIGGLPFNSNASVYSAATIGFATNIALSASNTISAVNQINSSYINIIQQPVGGGSDASVPMDVAGAMVLTCTYSV